MLLFPSALGPSSARPFRKITGSPFSCIKAARSFRLYVSTDHLSSLRMAVPIGDPEYTSHSRQFSPLFTISQHAAPIALPESLVNGGTQICLNIPASRNALFHLIFNAHPPAKQRFSSATPEVLRRSPRLSTSNSCRK